MEYSDEECNAKAEAAQREWAYNELCEEVDQLRLRNTELREDLRTASGNAKKYADMTLKLEAENPMLRSEVDYLRSELEDAQLKISAWKAKADRRADKISELEAEVERLRGGVPDFRSQSRIAIAGQLANSNAPIQQAEMSKAIKNLDQLTSIRIEENEDHD